MKKLFTLILFSFIFTQVTFAQSEKTFVKSLTADASTIAIDMAGAVKVSEWNEKIIRITTTVNLTNFNEDILKRLASVGRYGIESKLVDGVMVITMPKMATEVSIKGQLLNEVLSYEVLVPSGITVELVSDKDSTSADVN